MQCTEPQVEILTACMLGGDDANRAFNQSITLNLKGRLYLPEMESSIDSLIARHESLRMIFNIAENRFTVLEKSTVKLLVNKFPADPSSHQSILDQFRLSEAMFVFDLRKGPLFRATLFTDNKEKHHLVLTAHHVVCDGWSLALMVKDLGDIYNSLLKPGTLLDKPMRFTDYQKQENAYTQGSAYKEQEYYWLKQFEGYKPASPLPYDHPRPRYTTYKSRHITYPLSRELFASVRQVGKENGSSVLVTMASILEVMLYRLSGINEFVVGLPAAGQPPSGFESVLGHCVCLLPVKAEVDGKLSFSDYLKKRKQSYAEAFENRRVTFGSLLKTLKFSRDSSAVPMVPVSFNIDRPLMDNVTYEGLEADLEVNKREFSSFEMIINISRKEDDLVVECDYKEELFEQSTVMNFLRQYEFLAGKLCTEAARSIDSFSLHNVDELIEKLKVWNDTAADFPDNETLTGLFEKKVEMHAGDTALVFGDQNHTYKELNEKANKLARVLVGSGLKRGDFAGVMLERGPDMLISLLAVMKAGAAYIPIDPSFPADRISFMLKDSGARFLLAPSGAVEGLDAGVSIIDASKHIADSAVADVSNLALGLSSTDLAYLIYTSGSTGKPKGVLIEHRSLVNLLHSMAKKPGFTSKDKLLAVTTVSFDIAGLELYLPLISGGTLLLADREEVKDGHLLLDKIKNEKVTIMQATPSTFKLMLASSWDAIPTLTLLCGGEALNRELAMKLVPKCKALWNMYGPTETTIWSSIKKVSASDETITIGNPIDNTGFYILDDKAQLVPEGQVGEICISGAGLSRGYLGRDELTNEKFITHPLEPGKKIYRTGDLGKMLSNGEVICMGRTDTQIKVRGYRIEAGEIEYTLSSAGGIKEAVVIAWEGRQDDTRLTAFLVPEHAEKIQFMYAPGNNSIELSPLPKEKQEELKKTASASLPEYMIPTGYFYIKELPLTPNRKVDRKTLGEIDIMGVMSENRGGRSEGPVKEWGIFEKQLRQIWEETLGIKNARLDDNFFESGGHSLIGIELMDKIENRLQMKLPLSSLFAHPTISGLATLIANNGKSAWKYLVPIKPTGIKPPLYLVHGAGLEVMVFQEITRYMDEDQPVYGIQAMGLNDGQEPSTSVEEIAARYLEEILVHNPDGPYALAGFSAGSVIAYEMARQLSARGKKIFFLGNFDYSLENLHRKIPASRKLRNMVLEFAPRQVHNLKNLVKHPLRTAKFQANFLKLRIMGILSRLGVDTEEVAELPGMERIWHIMDQYAYALEHYDVKPYDGPMDLFRSKIKLYYLRDRQFLGWSPYVQNIRIHPVDGDHDCMILHPFSKGFANTLQKVLDQNNSQQGA